MFGLAHSQKMDGKSFCRYFLYLVWFSAYVVHREVGVSLLWLLAPPTAQAPWSPTAHALAHHQFSHVTNFWKQGRDASFRKEVLPVRM